MSTAFIGMGANLASVVGSPEATLAAAAERLGALGKVAGRSSLYSTEPVGFEDQPRFINAVVQLETELRPRALLDGLLAIEKEFGRDRSAGIANGPRTLDLDLLAFDDVTISEPGLVVPHPRLSERLFVLVPLGEVAPQWVDAQTGRTVSQLLHTLALTTKDKHNAVVPLQYEGWCSTARAGEFDGRAARTSLAGDLSKRTG